MANAVRDKQRSEVVYCAKLKRATKAVSKATTQEEMEDVIYSNDVVDILCGPTETKIRRLERELRDEKLHGHRFGQPGLLHPQWTNFIFFPKRPTWQRHGELSRGMMPEL